MGPWTRIGSWNPCAGRLAAFALIVAGSGGGASGQSLTAIDAGWYDESGAHDPANPRYFVGQLAFSATPGRVRNFFVFDLSSVEGPIVAATLSIYQPPGGFGSPIGREEYTAFDVSSDISSLVAGLGGQAAYDDLGSGASYGRYVFSDADTVSYISFSIDAFGVNDINAARGGLFAIGGALTSLDPVLNDEYAFRFSDYTSTPVTLQLQVDCNGNGAGDLDDILEGTSLDCNGNAVPDECEIAAGTPDLNANGVPDECEALNVTYCTTKVNSDGCGPLISFGGTPSASYPSPFSITAFAVTPASNGLLFYGLGGPAAAPFFGGTLCVAPPLRRTAIQNSGGSFLCEGVLMFDFNAWIQAGNDALIQVGSPVNAQWWYRDGNDALGVGLTNALEFFVGP